jgi:hypothetical protein
MKSKFKVAVSAIALALAGPALAAIDNGSSTPAGHTPENGELFLSVWDSANARSYTRDLGVRLNDFLPTGPVVAPGFMQSWGADAQWTSFVSGLTPQQVAGLKYDVIALDPVVVIPNRHRYLTTTNFVFNSGNTPFNNTLGQFAVVVNHVNAINSLGAAKNPTQSGAGEQFDIGNVAANNSLIAESSDGAAYFGTADKGEQWGGKVTNFVTTATVGVPLNVFLLSQSSASATARSSFDQFDNQFGAASFVLNPNGSLVYAAPVPEPESYALMLAGGLLVVAAMRRRANKK